MALLVALCGYDMVDESVYAAPQTVELTLLACCCTLYLLARDPGRKPYEKVHDTIPVLFSSLRGMSISADQTRPGSQLYSIER